MEGEKEELSGIKHNLCNLCPFKKHIGLDLNVYHAAVYVFIVLLMACQNQWLFSGQDQGRLNRILSKFLHFYIPTVSKATAIYGPSL